MADTGRPGLRRQVLQRRLRILTVPLAVARTARDLYANADADAVLVLLAHKTAVRLAFPHGRLGLAHKVSTVPHCMHAWAACRHNEIHASVAGACLLSVRVTLGPAPFLLIALSRIPGLERFCKGLCIIS